LLAANDRNSLLRWWGDDEPDVFAIVRDYVLRRVNQATRPSGYTQF